MEASMKLCKRDMKKLNPAFLMVEILYDSRGMNGSIIRQNWNVCNRTSLLSCRVCMGFFGYYFKDDYEKKSGKVFEMFRVSSVKVH